MWHQGSKGVKCMGFVLKKTILIFVVFFIFTLYGCSSNLSKSINKETYENNYEDGYKTEDKMFSTDANKNSYDSGYTDGYNAGYQQSYIENDCYEDLHSFQVAIAELMYAHEYEVVEKLLDYYPKGVETALEIEFGVKDLSDVINYLEDLSGTVVGNCEICGNPVFADEFAIPSEDLSYAHNKCVLGNKNNNQSHQKVKN